MLCLVSTTAYSCNQNGAEGGCESTQRKGYLFSRQEKIRILKFVTSTAQTQRRTPFTVQHVGSLVNEFNKYFLHEYLQLQSGTRNSTPQILSSKITFKKKLDSLSETAYFTFSGPEKEEWLRANSPYLLSKYKVLFLPLRLQMATLQSRIYEALIMLTDPLSFNPCQSNSSHNHLPSFYYIYMSIVYF